MPPELKAILQQRQAGDISSWARGFHRRDSWNARRASDSFQVRAGSCRCCKAADRMQAFVIENDMDKIPRPVTRHGAKAAQIHQKRAVAIEDDHFLLRHA